MCSFLDPLEQFDIIRSCNFMIGDGLFFITLFVLYFTYLFSIKVTGGQKKEKYYIGVLLYTIMLFI
jgi:hypothetical protein